MTPVISSKSHDGEISKILKKLKFHNAFLSYQPNSPAISEAMFCPIYLCLIAQIMSECIHDIIDFPKYHRKNLIDYCPGWFYRLGTYDLFWLFPRRLYSGECITYLVWITFQVRNLSNFSGGILENRWFSKYILTLSDL